MYHTTYIHVPNVPICILIGTLGALNRDTCTALHIHMYIHVPNVHTCILIGTLGPLNRDTCITLHLHTCTKYT